MFYTMSKYHKVIPSFGVMTDTFSSDEIDKIVFLEKLIDFQKAKIGADKKVDLNYRNSEICFIEPQENTNWIFEKLARYSAQANQDLFMQDISGIRGIQYTKYSGDVDGQYDWHIDKELVWQPMTRKISGVLMLSKPEDYEGGEFEIVTDGNINNVNSFKPNAGELIFFASWMPHRVKPVTNGTRKTLVFWIEGDTETN